MGESTTGTGRVILRHQCSKVNEILTGDYNLHGDAIIGGDTDSTYFKTYANDKDNAIKIANYVAKKINESYPDFMRNVFLCNSGYENIIKANREIVSDRGIFVEKKRYIIHITDLEGKEIDKMKVMGLDTKKTTIPKHVAEKLNNFIEQLLKGVAWEEIEREIVDYKKHLHNSPNILDIGLPKGVSKIDDYTIKFKQDSHTNLPGHVAAGIHYNLNLAKYNDKVSPPIRSGMKLKVFYLLGEHGRFKSIALPTDIEVIPDWFNNFQVDYDAHIERLVDNPLKNILKAINKESPSEESLQLKSLFDF